MPNRYFDMLKPVDSPAELLANQRERLLAELEDVSGKLPDARRRVLALGKREDELQAALKELDAAIRRLGLRPIASAHTDDAA